MACDCIKGLAGGVDLSVSSSANLEISKIDFQSDDRRIRHSSEEFSLDLCVGDGGGASWRMKALKRAKEQAKLEGDEVVEERWGSLVDSVASQRGEIISDKGHSREGDSLRHGVFRAPKTDPSLSWGGKRKGLRLIDQNTAHLHKFSELLSKHKTLLPSDTNKDTLARLSVNQLAAKSLQLRMKGKLEEAHKLMEEAERLKAQAKQAVGDDSSTITPAVRWCRRKNADDDDNADMHLAKSIMQSKQYKTSNQAADDEYDFGDKNSRKRQRQSSDIPEKDYRVKRIMTQQERCLSCFENPKRLKHLVVSIADFTYLMLPQHQPLVPGHCCILPMHHEAASRSVDDHVWDEIRNFKKCLIMMYAKQGKDAVFLETVVGLSHQRRHCLIECIPIPHEIAKEAPLYFKKAIDEAESEWSQHNAKKLIDTSLKGLRSSIPNHFPYFHVEFGLHRGFAHVIDDEQHFNTNLGLNVIRGMLELPEEDMYRPRRHDSIETQKKAVVSFARQWEHFDWTKQLH